MSVHRSRVTIVDYGLGNLFSVARALKYVGAEVEITDVPEKILNAEKLILPGVGAFGDGMNNLRERGLVEIIKGYFKSGRLLLGICLGMQLLMSEGEEFGLHKGLDLIQGRAVRLKPQTKDNDCYKIPHIGWNSILYPMNNNYKYIGRETPWKKTIFENLKEGVFVYFAHSNIVVPDNPTFHLAETEYGNTRFCSAIHKENIYGCQFHPEKSGEVGLEIYKQFVREKYEG